MIRGRQWPWRRALLAFGLSFVLTGLAGSLALGFSDFTGSSATVETDGGAGEGTATTAGTLQSVEVDPRSQAPQSGAEVAGAAVVSTARFAPLAEPIEVISTTTDPAAGNATGFDLADLVDRAGDAVDGWSGRDVVAVVADVTVTGTGPGAVLIHPGNRPADGLQLQLSDSGKLRAPHVPIYPDADGRVVFTVDPEDRTDAADEESADAGFEIAVNVRGVYVESEETTAGRYRHVGVAEVASLVPVTDGREVTVDLSAVPGLAAREIGHAVLRFNANVGADGGSVSLRPGGVDDADDERTLTMWPSPPQPRPGLGGTGVALVPVGPDGKIELVYRGGSILNVDLVGYFTNGRAERSASGLFLPSAPELLSDGYESPADSIDVIVGDVVGGADGAAVLARGDAEPDAARLIFNLGPDQRRISPLWLDESVDLDLSATEASLWRVGTYTP